MWLNSLIIFSSKSLIFLAQTVFLVWLYRAGGQNWPQ